jgi:hypothetical protein
VGIIHPSVIIYCELQCIAENRQRAYGVRCASAGTLVQNYGATNVAPTQKDKPLLSSKRGTHFQTRKRSWNQEQECWQVPAAINWNGHELVSRES